MKVENIASNNNNALNILEKSLQIREEELKEKLNSVVMEEVYMYVCMYV